MPASHNWFLRELLLRTYFSLNSALVLASGAFAAYGTESKKKEQEQETEKETNKRRKNERDVRACWKIGQQKQRQTKNNKQTTERIQSLTSNMT